MSGTKIGGMKAATTNKLRNGEDFYRRIGAKGGRNGHNGGFAANPELAKLAGRKGGKMSRRGKGCKHEIELNADMIKHLYLDEKYSAIKISSELGIPYSVIQKYIRNKNIEGWK